MNPIFLLTIIFLSSFVLTMIGLGGGLIFSPLFILLGIPLSTAVAMSLLLNGIAAVSATTVYIRKKMVDFKIAVPLIIGSSVGAPLGAITTQWVNLKLFLSILALFLFFASMRMLFIGQIQPHRDLSDHQWKMIGGGLIGLVIGFVAGLLGIGGGVLVVPLLIFFLGTPTKQAAATSMFIVCFSSLAGFITHASIAAIDWKLVLPAAVMCLIGGQLGSRIMVAKLKGRMVQILFGIVLLGFVAKLLQKIFL